MVFRALVAVAWNRPRSSTTRWVMALAHSLSRGDPVNATATPGIGTPLLERRSPTTLGVTCSVWGIGSGMHAGTPRATATRERAESLRGERMHMRTHQSRGPTDRA